MAGFLLVVALVCLATIKAGPFLVVNDATQHADAIVSLGGDVNGFPRVHHAVELYELGYAPVVVLSGGTMASVGLEMLVGPALPGGRPTAGTARERDDHRA